MQGTVQHSIQKAQAPAADCNDSDGFHSLLISFFLSALTPLRNNTILPTIKIKHCINLPVVSSIIRLIRLILGFITFTYELLCLALRPSELTHHFLHLVTLE